MSFIPEIHEATARFVRILEAMGLSYAVGGAVAMAFGGHVRGTRDVDVLVLLPDLRTQELADALNDEGFAMRDDHDRPTPVEVVPMVRSARDVGLFRVWWKETKVEVFTPRVPLQDSILRRRLRMGLEGLQIWITTVEDLILLKMIFHRPKDLEDVRHLLAANGDTLDSGYIASWIVRTLEPSVGEELRGMMRQAGVKA